MLACALPAAALATSWAPPTHRGQSTLGTSSSSTSPARHARGRLRGSPTRQCQPAGRSLAVRMTWHSTALGATWALRAVACRPSRMSCACSGTALATSTPAWATASSMCSRWPTLAHPTWASGASARPSCPPRHATARPLRSRELRRDASSSRTACRRLLDDVLPSGVRPRGWPSPQCGRTTTTTTGRQGCCST